VLRLRPSVPSPTVPPKKTLGSRLILSGMGAVLMSAGIFFTYHLWDSFQRSEETRHWLETPCEIITSQVNTYRPVANSPDEYRAVVRYRYELNGVIHHNESIRHGMGPTMDRATAEERIAKYPIGKKTACFVNPEQPDKAVLEHTSRAGLYTIWFPMLFVAGGFGMILNAWRDKRVRAIPTKK